MSTKQSFNPAEVEPAMVNFIQDSNVNQEQLDQKSTPAEQADKPTNQVAPDAQTPAQQPVQATPQDSEVYKNLQAHFTKVSQDNSELRNEVMQLRRELAQRQQQQPTIPAQQQDTTNLDEVNKVADDFEELKPIASSMKTMQGQIDAQNAKIAAQQENLNNNAQYTAEQTRFDTIARTHADCIAITNSVDFAGWLARQPAYMQSLMPNGPAKEVIDLITAYKSSTQTQDQPVKDQQQQDQLEAARLASVPDTNSPAPKLTPDSSKRIYSNAEIGAMSYKQYAALADDIELAMTEGRITV